jgi:hypothetical protein
VSSPSIAPTSTAPTASSFDDLSALGEYILDLLGRDRRSEDLLVHWVAHRLAEHMQRAERARTKREREEAREAAALLITRLWETRAGWTMGWPPEALKMLERALGPFERWREEESADEPLAPWVSSLESVAELQRREYQAWLYAALLETDAAPLRRALEVAPKASLDDDSDLRLLRTQVDATEKAETWIMSLAAEGEDPSRRADRASILGRVLAGIADERNRIAEQALKDARRNQKRKRAVQTSSSAR